MLNVALIGIGAHCCGNHAPALQHFAQQHPDAVRLAAACDLDEARAKRACEEFGFEQAFTDIDAMFDAVDIHAVEAIVHIADILPVGKQLFARGIPSMIEKPLGRDLPEARAIADAAQQSGAPVMVSLNRRFDPAVRIALDWAAEHGPIRALQGSQLRHNRTEDYYLWGTALHLLDLMCHVAGPLSLRPSGTVLPACRGGHDRIAHLDGPNGLVASATILPCCGRLEERIRIVGDDYCVDCWTGSTHPWRVEGYRDGKLLLHEQCPPDEPVFLRNGAWGETEAFLRAVLDGKPLPGPTPHDALVASEIAEGLRAM